MSESDRVFSRVGWWGRRARRGSRVASSSATGRPGWPPSSCPSPSCWTSSSTGPSNGGQCYKYYTIYIQSFVELDCAKPQQQSASSLTQTYEYIDGFLCGVFFFVVITFCLFAAQYTLSVSVTRLILFVCLLTVFIFLSMPCKQNSVFPFCTLAINPIWDCSFLALSQMSNIP